ncbi:MAG: maltose alpha-D-glucosyltransferase [Ignavibacteriaceae bacterium]
MDENITQSTKITDEEISNEESIIIGSEKNSLWYKDGIIYQVHIKAFRDSNDDGFGDFNGLIEKLDYIRDLGVNIIWILPFYPSPMKDDGYDISDYFDINPDYGTIIDFKRFLKEAHNKGIKVITELVLNHTSDQHDLFQKARKSEPGSKQRDFYVWTEIPDKYLDARIIFSDFESSNWSWDPVAKAYYWHRFYSHQPDLNFENPEVHKFLFRAVDFWFDLGVDGLRLDAVPYLYEKEGTSCENLPETHEFLKKLSKHISENYKDKMLLAEANQWAEDAVAYFGKGDECQMAFHFPLMPRMYMAIQMEDRFPIIDILEQTPDIPENCQWAMFLRNHDELTLEMVTDEERDYMYRFFAKDNRARLNFGIRRRLAPLVENNRRKIELLNILLFSFPGTPIIYYGDEIGMGDNYYLGDRNGVRTPMQWNSDRNAGFSDTNPQRLYLPIIIDPEYHYEAINVEVQQRNPSSLLWWMKKALAIRKRYKAFGRGKIEFLSPQNPKVIAFLRIFGDEIILVVANLSRFSQVVELDLSKFMGYTPIETFSLNRFPPIGELYYMLTLSPYDHYWFELKKINKTEGARRDKIIPEVLNKDDVFKEKFLLNYIEQTDWFKKGEFKIDNIQILDKILISGKDNILILKIFYVDELPEIYLLSVTHNAVTFSGAVLYENVPAVMAEYKDGVDNPMVIFDGIYDETFQQNFMESFAVKRSIKGDAGELNFSKEKKMQKFFADSRQFSSSKLLKADNRNILILYNENIILKLYRKLEEGINPGAEVSAFLSNSTPFQNIHQYAGKITFEQPDSEPVTVGLLKKYIPNQGDAWTYFLDAAKKYFENLYLNNKGKKRHRKALTSLFTPPSQLRNGGTIADAVDHIYIEMAGLLGERTAQLHLALSSDNDNKDFVPEPYSTFYQRSVYQTLRSTTKNAFRLLRKYLNDLDKDLQTEAKKVLEFEEEIIDYIALILRDKINAKRIRIHGDFHLRQILFTGKDFIITNFEGPSSMPFSERRMKRGALRDVASIIWSFHFAAFVASFTEDIQNKAEIAKSEQFASQWWLFIGNRFLNSYLDNVNHSDFLPEEKDEVQYLFHFYLLEKILQELTNCLKENSPWLNIPFKGLQYMKRFLKDKN